MEFIRINNRKNFLIDKVPVIHPQSVQYIYYWRRHKQRCIEGLWSIDDNSVNLDINESDNEVIISNKSKKWRWMPGNLYFYVNFGTILHKEKGQKSRKKIRPQLRDYEWEFFYLWMECRGFSGFKDDEEFSCNYQLVEYQKDKTVKLPESCLNSKGEIKKYINPRTYIRQLFDRPMGIALFENESKGMMMLGSRGLGKSYCVGVGIILHAILFDDAKEFNEESRLNPFKVEILVGAGISDKSSDLLNKVKEALQELPGRYGIGTNNFKPSPFFKTMSGTLAPNNGKNPWRHEYSKKIGGEWVPRGTGSSVKHVIYKDNAEAGAGGRYTINIVEETGLVDNALTVHGSNVATQREGTERFGSDLWLGTGGNVEKIQESKIIFRDPRGFDMLAFDDIWEGTGEIGWFVSSIYALNQFKDENGNTDIQAASDFRNKRRELARKSKDKSALDNEMMNYPLVPSEMFLNATGAYFPQGELKAQKAEIIAKPHLYSNAHYYGDIVINSKGELTWQQLDRTNLVTEWPIKNNKDKPGVIEIFEQPKRDSSGNVFQNRYIQGTDTYDDDESSTNSLGSTFIMDLWTNRIVAEYTGRRLTSEFYEICRKLNLYYRASHNYENNKKGLYWHYEKKGSIPLLCDTPESLRDVMDITISKVGNKAKGTSVTTPVIAYGLRLILDWLMEPAYGEDNPEILNLHKIRSVGLLDELMNYNSKGNFDRVSALIMLLILKEDKYKVALKRDQKHVNDLANDKFFQKHYRNKSSPDNWLIPTFDPDGRETTGKTYQTIN